MFDIEVKRLWNVPEDDIVFVYPLKLDNDVEQLVLVVTKSVQGCSGLERNFLHNRFHILMIRKEAKINKKSKSFEELNRPRYTAHLIKEGPPVTERFKKLIRAPKTFPSKILLMTTAQSFGLFDTETLTY